MDKSESLKQSNKKGASTSFSQRGNNYKGALLLSHVDRSHPTLRCHFALNRALSAILQQHVHGEMKKEKTKETKSHNRSSKISPPLLLLPPPPNIEMH